MAVFKEGLSLKRSRSTKQKRNECVKSHGLLDLYGPTKELPATIDVLSEHLLAKVRELFPKSAESEKYWEALMVHDENDILQMLQNKNVLMFEIQKLNALDLAHSNPNILTTDLHSACPTALEQSQEYADELFQRINGIEPNLCAHITGMILELDSVMVQTLLGCDDELKMAVAKAKMVYLQSLHPGRREEVIGEYVYEQVLSFYPDKADRITGVNTTNTAIYSRRNNPQFYGGMLMDAGTEQLEELLADRQELRRRIDQAHKVL